MNGLRFAIAVLLAALLSVPAMTRAEIIDRIVAKVNDEIVTQTDLLRMLPIYVQVFGVDTRALSTSESRNELANDVVAYLIETHLMIEDAEERGLSVTEDEVDRYITQQSQSMNLTVDEFAEALAQEGIDIRDFRQFMLGRLTRLRLLQLDVMAQITVTEQDIDRELAELYPDGLEEIQLTTSHILVAVPPDASPTAGAEALERIESLHAELEAGRAFAEIAAEVNPDGSRNTGGRIGTYGLGQLDPDYERAAMGLEVGEVSEPVRTRFGYHLIRLESLEREPVDDAQAIRDRIAFQLQQQAAEQQEEVYLERVRNEAYVEVLVDEFDL